KDKAARIFERFYQVDGSSRRRFCGAGIGLAIVQRIVDAHHGDIWVKSELNKGSTFYITLPKKQPDSPSAFPTLSAHVYAPAAPRHPQCHSGAGRSGHRPEFAGRGQVAVPGEWSDRAAPGWPVRASAKWRLSLRTD